MTTPAEEKGVASFPAPPSSLYKLYTDGNVRSGLAPKPPAPVKGKYHMFGCLFDVGFPDGVSVCIYTRPNSLCLYAHTQTEDAMIRPLEEQGLERLYPPNYGQFIDTFIYRYTSTAIIYGDVTILVS